MDTKNSSSNGDLELICNRLSPRSSKIVRCFFVCMESPNILQFRKISHFDLKEKSYVMHELISDIKFIVNNGNITRKTMETSYFASAVLEVAKSRIAKKDYQVGFALTDLYKNLIYWVNSYKNILITGGKKGMQTGYTN